MSTVQIIALLIASNVALIGIVYKILDREIQTLRKWRHMKGDPYIGAMDQMNKRVDRIEKVLNGKLR